MGYAFTMEEPSDDMPTPCGFSNYQMNHVRLVMLWVSVIDGDGYKAQTTGRNSGSVTRRCRP